MESARREEYAKFRDKVLTRIAEGSKRSDFVQHEVQLKFPLRISSLMVIVYKDVDGVEEEEEFLSKYRQKRMQGEIIIKYINLIVGFICIIFIPIDRTSR